MSTLRAAWRAAAIATLIQVALPGAPLIAASQAQPVLALDCWIATDRRSITTEYIRCIRNRDDGSPEPLPALAVLGRSEVATIPIYSYPSPWSWAEQEPQHLVRATLCPNGYHCPVYFRDDATTPPALTRVGTSNSDTPQATRRPRRDE